MANDTAPVLVAGHICLDLLPRIGRFPEFGPGQLSDVGPMTVRSGGCVANTGLDLAALGVDVRLAADVGDDRLGELLLALLERPGVDTTAIRRVPGTTSYSLVLQPDGLDRAFWHHVGANESFDGRALHLDGVGILHIGYPTALPSLQSGSCLRLVELLTDARRKGIVTSVDLSTFDSQAPTALVDWFRVIRTVGPLVDVFSASVDDLACITGWTTSDAHKSAELLVDLGAAVALVKAGAEGLHLCSAGVERLRRSGSVLESVAESWSEVRAHVPSVEVEILSTTGAGDAAVAGLLFGMQHGMGALNAASLATIVAAQRIGTHGDLPKWTPANYATQPVPAQVGETMS